MSPCTVCNRALEPADVLYSKAGFIICANCESQLAVAKLEKRASSNIGNAAISSLLVAIVSWIFNPFYLLTALCIATGASALRALSLENAQFTQHSGSKRGGLQAVAIIGLVVGCLPVLLRVLGWLV